MELVDKIAITWSSEDVLSLDPDLTKEQVSEVLTRAKRYHDSSIGINWDVIKVIIDLVKEK